MDAKPDSAADSATEKIAFYFDPRDLVPEPLFCCDAEGWILWLNRAAEQLLGRAAHELIGMSFADLFPPDDRSRLALHFVRHHWRGVTESYWEAPLVSASGRSHWAGLRVRLLRASNGRMVYVCAAHDLQAIHTELEETRRKAQAAMARADEAAAAAELKSEFLATTSQELRIPMSGVVGMSRLLLESELNRDQRMFAEVIQNSVESLLGLVDDILDYSRIEAAKLSLQDIDFDLRVAVDAVAAMVSSRATAKGLTFAFGVHHRVPSLLTGDPGRLRQVLISLAGNTIHFAESGEMSMRVELTEETPHGVTLRFWLRAAKVADPDGRPARLLRAFAAGDAALVSEFGSAGLGLSISRRLVALMGGRVGTGGDGDPGITVWIDLPFEKQAERREPVPEGPVELAGLRVLVIGPVAATRLGMAETLTALGCVCTEIEDTEDALDVMRQAAREGTPYPLVFVDYDPSGVDPTAFARSIRSDKALNRSSLALTTIVGRQGDAARAEEWGYAAYLVMPLEREELREAVEEILRRSKATSSAGLSLVTRHTVAEQRRQRSRVLVVEDDPIDQLVVSAAIRRMGYEPLVVKSGKEALEAVDRQPFDVIFLDLVMPGINGWKVASIIRGKEAGGRRTPIIATTAHDSEEDRARCRAAGMDGCLTKPLDFETMSAMIKAWTSTSKESPSSGDRSSDEATNAAAAAPQEPILAKKGETQKGLKSGAEIVRIDDTVPVIDTNRLEISCLGNAELRSSLVTAFSAHSQAPMERLGKAIEAGDAAAVELESHTLRGMCVSLGAARCGILFRRLETAARDGNDAHWHDLYRRAQVELARADDQLSQREQAA